MASSVESKCEENLVIKS